MGRDEGLLVGAVGLTDGNNDGLEVGDNEDWDGNTDGFWEGCNDGDDVQTTIPVLNIATGTLLRHDA